MSQLLQRLLDNSAEVEGPLETPCLIWLGSWRDNMYGQIYWNGKSRLVHRLAYEEYYEPIEDGLLVCHRCDNPWCFRKEHLFKGTYEDNNSDRERKGRSAKGNAAFLRESDVIQIRGLLSKGFPQSYIASKFSVSQQLVSLINTGKRWRAE